MKAVGREEAEVKRGKSENRKNFEDTFMYFMGVFFTPLIILPIPEIRGRDVL